MKIQFDVRITYTFPETKEEILREFDSEENFRKEIEEYVLKELKKPTKDDPIEVELLKSVISNG